MNRVFVSAQTVAPVLAGVSILLQGPTGPGSAAAVESVCSRSSSGDNSFESTPAAASTDVASTSTAAAT